MSDREMRRAAVDSLRYGGAMQGAAIGGLGRYEPTPEELVEQRKWTIRHNRQQVLGHTLALGRNYDHAEQAIEDARVIAKFLDLEID